MRLPVGSRFQTRTTVGLQNNPLQLMAEFAAPVMGVKDTQLLWGYWVSFAVAQEREL